MGISQLWSIYSPAYWYIELRNYIDLRFRAIENRMIQTFDYVTPSNQNRDTYSYTYASILRDACSVFDSGMTKLITNIEKKDKTNIYDYLAFYYKHDRDLYRMKVKMKTNLKELVPFEKEKEGLPNWWHAYNEVKHDESSNIFKGNFENALNALAGLSILFATITGSNESIIFSEIGRTPSLSLFTGKPYILRLFESEESSDNDDKPIFQ